MVGFVMAFSGCGSSIPGQAITFFVLMNALIY